MRRLSLVLLVLLASALPLGTPRVHAQLPPPWPGDPTQGMPSISQVIRQAGYALPDAEAAYLDADQAVQVQYMLPFAQVLRLAGPPDSGLPAAEHLAEIVALLQQVQALDPNAAPSAPPALERLRTLMVQHRAALQRVATAWLAALQAGDPEWRTRGADDFLAAQQALLEWQQELAARYPPPTAEQR